MAACTGFTVRRLIEQFTAVHVPRHCPFAPLVQAEEDTILNSP